MILCGCMVQEEQIPANRLGALEAGLGDIDMATQDIPASWVMEGGDLLPEPGEEEAWLRAHNEKMATRE